jgi:hypothetical protein
MSTIIQGDELRNTIENLNAKESIFFKGDTFNNDSDSVNDSNKEKIDDSIRENNIPMETNTSKIKPSDIRTNELHKVDEISTNPTFILISALIITLISAYLTIHGYIGLFSGYTLQIGIMLAALEISKFTIASAILTSTVKTVQRPFLIVIMIILVMIAFIGHYSYLSQAYFNNKINFQVGQVEEKMIDERIENIKLEISSLKETYESFHPVNYRTKRLVAYEKVKEPIKKLNTELVSLMNDKREMLSRLKTKDSKQEGTMIYTSELLGINEDTLANIIIIALALIIDPLGLLLASLSITIRNRKKISNAKII